MGKRRSCTGKTQYSKTGAAEKVRHLHRTTVGHYNKYQCKFCGFWHVGHRRHRKSARVKV